MPSLVEELYVWFEESGPGANVVEEVFGGSLLVDEVAEAVEDRLLDSLAEWLYGYFIEKYGREIVVGYGVEDGEAVLNFSLIVGDVRSDHWRVWLGEVVLFEGKVPDSWEELAAAVERALAFVEGRLARLGELKRAL